MMLLAIFGLVLPICGAMFLGGLGLLAGLIVDVALFAIFGGDE